MQNRDFSLKTSVLNNVVNEAGRYGADEVWLFGSVINETSGRCPHDIDIAVLGVSEGNFIGLANDLMRRFLNCRVERAGDYSINPEFTTSARHTPPLHFVIGDEDAESGNHPIFKSIRSGKCLWQNHNDMTDRETQGEIH